MLGVTWCRMPVAGVLMAVVSALALAGCSLYFDDHDQHPDAMPPAPDAQLSGPPDAMALPDAIDAELVDACAARCESAISCEVIKEYQYPACYSDCIGAWYGCDALVDYVKCIDNAEGDAVCSACAGICD